MSNNKSHNPNGREVLVKFNKGVSTGVEVSLEVATRDNLETKKQLNGPHHEAKWARDMTDRVIPHHRITKKGRVEIDNIVIHARPVAS